MPVPTCRYCGAALTAPASIARGYGARCGFLAGVLTRDGRPVPDDGAGRLLARERALRRPLRRR